MRLRWSRPHLSLAFTSIGSTFSTTGDRLDSWIIIPLSREAKLDGHSTLQKKHKYTDSGCALWKHSEKGQ